MEMDDVTTKRKALHYMTLDSKFDSILVRGQRCRIYEIRPVDVKALRAAQKQARKDDDDDKDD